MPYEITVSHLPNIVDVVVVGGGIRKVVITQLLIVLIPSKTS